MKRNLFLRLCLMMTVLLFLNSCRQEYFQSDTENQKNKFQVSLLNRQEVNKIAPLMGKIAELKKNSFEQSNSLSARKVQDSLLEGAIIGTNEVLVVDNGNHKTYTFPVFRTFISTKTESLVLKQNEDGSFKGILIQYDITRQEKEQFISGQNLDISAKTKIYDIENIDLNTNARVQIDVVGCYKITWETGWCSKGVHQTGQDATCEVGGAPAPFIQSIEDICENTNTGTNAPGGYLGISSNGVSLDMGNYFTIPFISIGHQYYETEDPNDPNYVLYNTVAGYFSMLGSDVVQLRAANPDLFYYAYYYFKDNGVNSTTRAFITQRLVGLKNWYTAVNNTPNTIPANNQYFLNWAFQHLVQNPHITWADFYDEFLATPCEKIKTQRTDANFNNKMTDLKGKTGLKKETGYIQRANGEYTYKDNASATNEANELNLPNPELTENKDIIAYFHTHVNDFSYDDPENPVQTITKKGFKIFSPADVNYFMKMIKNAQDAGRPLGDVYAVLVSSLKNYQIRFTGDQSQIKVFTDPQKNAFREPFKDFMKKYSKNLELGFLKFIYERMNLRGVSLYRMNSDGTTSEIKLNADKTDTDETNCPQ